MSSAKTKLEKIRIFDRLDSGIWRMPTRKFGLKRFGAEYLRPVWESWPAGWGKARRM